MALRNFSSTAVGTTLTAGVNNVVTTIPVAATTGFPSVPFICIIDPDTTAEEVVLVTTVAGLNLTVTRGYDSTTAVAHLINAKFQHSFAGIDFREPNAFLNSGGTIGGAVTVSGTLASGQFTINRQDTGSEGGEIIMRRAVDNGTGYILDVYGATTAPQLRLMNSATTKIWYFNDDGATLFPGEVSHAGSADTATAASHYFVETGTDGYIRPKTLANVKSEILTNAVIDNVQASAAGTAADLWSEVTTGSIAIGAGLTTGALNLATVGTGATPISIGHTNAVITETSATHTLTAATSINLNSATVYLSAVADSASAASHYFFEGSTDGAIRPKTLANVKTEIVTTAAVNTAAATTTGTVTSGTWSSAILNSTATSAQLIAPEEKTNIQASAITASTTFDVLSGQILYYTTASTAGAVTLNIRGNAGTTLASLIPNDGDTLSCNLICATGATTPAYVSVVQIDGTVTGVTTKWQYGTGPTAGSTSATDGYTFTVINTAAGYTVFASFAKAGT